MGAKPVINSINPWDATQGQVINFQYSGAIPVSNRAVIYDAATLRVVYDDVYTSTALSHYIPPNAFKVEDYEPNGNGHKYAIQIQVQDSNGITSPYSDKVFFWCFATPQFYYTYPVSETTTDQASINVKLVYSQADGEKIYNYRHQLYDNSKILVSMSDTFFDEENYEYTFKGLENMTAYYVRAQGITKNGLSLDTGMVKFYVNRFVSETFDVLGLQSDLNASVYGMSNMICIDANEDAGDFVYLNSTVQLGEKSITYEKNYKIARDFTMQLKFTKLWNNGIILYMYNKNNPSNTITIDQYLFDDDTIRYCLKVFNGIATYVLYSEPIIAQHNDYVVLNIRRINNVFSLEAIKVE